MAETPLGRYHPERDSPRQRPPPTRGQTNASENTTFPQLRLRAVTRCHKFQKVLKIVHFVGERNRRTEENDGTADGNDATNVAGNSKNEESRFRNYGKLQLRSSKVPSVCSS